MNWGGLLKNRTNVYLIGSGIKYARSTAGLGYLIHPLHDGPLQKPKKSGWCAYFHGLTTSKTINNKGQLLYEQRWQWLGGTLANIFSLELFINTWDAIARTGETLKTMHHYVQTLHHYFYKLSQEYVHFDLINLTLDMPRRRQFPEFSSSTLTIKIARHQAIALVRYANHKQIYFDQRKNDVIRLGFGIQHSKHDVQCLVDILMNFKSSA